MLSLDRYEANGNDFAVALLEPPEFRALDKALDGLGLGFEDLARAVCNRCSGVSSRMGYVYSTGADGLVIGIHPPSVGQPRDRLRMHLWNADGSLAEISGNGLACLASAAVNAGKVAPGEIRCETDAGRQRCIVDTGNHSSPSLPNVDCIRFVKVFMPKVRPGPEKPEGLEERIRSDFGDDLKDFDTGDVGNPHLVIALARPPVDIPASVSSENTDELGKQLGARIAELGRAYEDEFFPAGINVEFIWPDRAAGPNEKGKRRELIMSVWERGAGLTVSCGSGAVVAATLAHRWRFLHSEDDQPSESSGTATRDINGRVYDAVALNTAPFPGCPGEPFRYTVFVVRTGFENDNEPQLRVMAGRVAAGIQFPLDAVREHAEHFAGSG